MNNQLVKLLEKIHFNVELVKRASKELPYAVKFVSKGLLDLSFIKRFGAVISTYSFLPEFIEFWNNYDNHSYINQCIEGYAIPYHEYPDISDVNRLFRKLDVYPSALAILNHKGEIVESFYLVNRGKKEAKFVSTPSFTVSLGYEDYLTYELVPDKHINKFDYMQLLEFDEEGKTDIGFIALRNNY